MMNGTPALPAWPDEHLAGLSLEQLIDLLIRDEDRAPRNVIDHCAARGEEMVAQLRAALDNDHAWRSDVSPGEWWLRLHAVMILGLVASESAGLLLVWFMRRMALSEDWEFRLAAGNTLLDFPRERHCPLLADLAARQKGLGVHFSPEDVEKFYAHGRDQPDWARFKDTWKFYAPGAIARRQDRWAEEAARENEDVADIDGEFFDEPALPHVRPAEKVGRNDPCPCGSGKKYKKCCGLKEPA